jgi:folylpolyglutamate synthase/dihydropteroate synthase
MIDNPFTDFIHSHNGDDHPETQKKLAATWTQIGGQQNVLLKSTVKETVDHVHSKFKGASVVVVGNVYLAGAVRFLSNAESVC